MSARDVLFTLKAIVDPATRETVSAFAQTVTAAHKQASAAADTAAKSAATAYKRASDDIASASQQLTQTQKAATAAVVAAEKSAADGIVSVHGTLADKINAARSRIDKVEDDRRKRALEKFQRIEAEKVKAAEAGERAIAEAVRRAQEAGVEVGDREIAALRERIAETVNKRIEKLDQDLYQAKLRESERVAAYEEKQAIKHVHDLERAAEAEERARIKSASAAERASVNAYRASRAAIDDSARASEAFSSKARQAFREAMTAGAELGESVMKIARGFVALSLVGEKDLDKLKDRILSMQGAFDLVSGSIQTFLKITKSIEQMRAAIIAATAAQNALNASQTAGAFGGLFNSAAAIGGGLAARFGLRAGASTAASSIAGTGAYAGAGAYLGTGGGVAAGGGTTAAAAGLPIMPVTAATVGSLFGLTAIGDSAYQTVRNGQFFGGASRGSFTDIVGGSWLNPFGYLTAGDVRYQEYQTARGSERAERAKAAYAAANASRDTMAAQAAGGYGAAASAIHAQAASSFEVRTADMSSEEKRAALVKEIADEERRVKDMRAEAAKYDDRLGAIRDAYEQQAVNSEQRILELLHKKQQTEREIAREKKTAAEDALRTSERELENQKRMVDAKRSSLMSAAERFGLMDEEQQQQILELSRRQKRGDNLTAEELRTLQGAGVESVDKSIAEEARRRAAAAGFNEISHTDQQQLRQMEEQQRKLELVVQDKRDIVVNVQAMSEQKLREVQQAVLNAINTSDKETQARLQQMTNEINDLRLRHQSGAGGR